MAPSVFLTRSRVVLVFFRARVYMSVPQASVYITPMARGSASRSIGSAGEPGQGPRWGKRLTPGCSLQLAAHAIAIAELAR